MMLCIYTSYVIMYATLSLHVAMKEVLWSQIRTDNFEWFTLAHKVKVFQNYYNVNIAWQQCYLGIWE